MTTRVPFSYAQGPVTSNPPNVTPPPGTTLEISGFTVTLVTGATVGNRSAQWVLGQNIFPGGTTQTGVNYCGTGTQSTVSSNFHAMSLIDNDYAPTGGQHIALNHPVIVTPAQTLYPQFEGLVGDTAYFLLFGYIVWP